MSKFNHRQRHDRASSHTGKQSAQAKRRRAARAVKEAAEKAGHPQMDRMLTKIESGIFSLGMAA